MSVSFHKWATSEPVPQTLHLVSLSGREHLSHRDVSRTFEQFIVQISTLEQPKHRLRMLSLGVGPSRRTWGEGVSHTDLSVWLEDEMNANDINGRSSVLSGPALQ